MANYRGSFPRRIFLLLALILVLAILSYVFYLLPAVGPKPSITPLTSVSAQTGAVPELADASCHARDGLPDPVCTPGTASPSVTQDNLFQTICVSGYTKTVRPPVSYTNKLKLQQMREYGFTDSIRLHEEDHLISLELGGDPADPKNLWPEPGQSPNPKDRIENVLHAAVCSGHISLKEAQARISINWVTAGQGL